MKVRSISDYRRWVKMQMAAQDLSQADLAERVGVTQPRISDSIYGKPKGLSCMKSIIKELGGSDEDFTEFLSSIDERKVC